MTHKTTPDATPPRLLLSVDPGKTSGVSIFRDGQVESTSQVKIEDFPQAMADFVSSAAGTDNVVDLFENFKLFKKKALQQSGSEMEASQVIGQLKMVAAQNKWKIVEQSPQIKKIAEMWSKTKPPSNHAQSHWVDAYNHGVYWLIKNGMRRIEE